MVQQRHLENAPVKEAIIDIRVNFAAPINIDDLQSQLESIEDEYPDTERLEKRTVEIGQSQDSITHRSLDEEPYCLKYTSSDKTYIVQFQKEGFTLSKIEPYSNWQEFKGEAFRLWNIYKDITKPESIKRIAVRYINIMEFKVGASQLAKFLTYTPSVPIENSKLNGFLNRNSFYDYDHDANVILTQALENIDADNIRIILDVDAFKDKDFEISDDKYINDFEKLHDLKNNIFFASITEKTAEKYS